MNRKIVPDIVNAQTLTTLPETANVQDAAKAMAEKRIGAVVVMAGTDLTGIFTERDIVTRVLAADKDPGTTPLSEVMTKDPHFLPPSASAREALEVMQSHRFRHLPIIEDGSLVAILSIRDLHEAVMGMLEEEVSQREQMMFGSNHGLA